MGNLNGLWTVGPLLWDLKLQGAQLKKHAGLLLFLSYSVTGLYFFSIYYVGAENQKWGGYFRCGVRKGTEGMDGS